MVNTTVALDDVKSNVISYLSTKYTHFAVGTGTTADSSSDTALEEEVFRDVIDAAQTSTSSVLFRCYLGTTEANGYALTEFGGFDSATGGTMLFRKVFPAINKTSDMDIWFELEETITVS